MFNDEKKPIAHQITSGDFCFITYFEHFTNMYINKVKKNKQNLIYEPVDFDILEKTAESTGNILFRFNDLIYIYNIIKFI